MTTYKSIKYNISGADLTGLTASQIPNLDTSKITSGTLADARIGESSVTQHVTSTNLVPLKQDIALLALREQISSNATAYHLNNSFIDHFEDDTGIGQECSTDGKFDGYRAIQTAGWGGASANYGFQIELVAGKTHPLDFGTGPFTIELFSKNVNSSQPSQFETLYATYDGTTAFMKPTAWYNGQPTSYVHNPVIPGTGWYSAHNMHNALHVTSWVHSAYCRDASGNHSFWVNGGSSASSGTGSAISPNSGTAYRDYNQAGTYSRDIDLTGAGAYFHLGVDGGKIRGQFADYSMIRFSDIARYDPTQTSITVPTEAFVGQSGVANATGTMTSVALTPQAPQTKVSGVMLYSDESGTGTIGGGSYDLKIEFTCDGGSNWTEAASYTALTPVFSTGVKMVRLGETTCTQGTDVRYRAVFANQASGSKETRLHGIGINY